MPALFCAALLCLQEHLNQQQVKPSFCAWLSHRSTCLADVKMFEIPTKSLWSNVKAFFDMPEMAQNGTVSMADVLVETELEERPIQGKLVTDSAIRNWMYGLPTHRHTDTLRGRFTVRMAC